MFKNGFRTDERIATTLVNLYARCGRLEDARKVFDRMVLKEAQLWNMMIAGYMAVGKVDCATELFVAMLIVKGIHSR